MRDYRDRIEKLLTDAADCDLIGNLAGDAVKRATFRRLAVQFRDTAQELKAEMEGVAFVPVSDRQFLLDQAGKCRELLATVTDKTVRAEIQRMADEFEAKAGQA